MSLSPILYEVLRREVAISTMRACAIKLGVSPALVSQVLAKKYNHDTRRLATLIEAHLLQKKVECRAVGGDAIDYDICLREQTVEFNAMSPLRVQIHKACRSGCPHFHGKA